MKNANQKKETAKYWYRGLSSVIITFVNVIAFYVIWMERMNARLPRQYENSGNYLMAVVYMIITIVFINTFGGYNVGINRISHVILAQWLAMIFVNFLELVILILMMGDVRWLSRTLVDIIALTAIEAFILFFVTFIVMKLYRVIFPPYHMVMVYGKYKNNLSNKMNARDDKYVIDGEISYEEPIEEIYKKIEDFDAVLVNDVPSNVKNQVIKHCFEIGKRVYFTPKISDILIKNSTELNLFDTPLYVCRNLEMSFGQRFIKRAGDIIISLIGIILTSPIMAVTAICIKKYDGGPAIYKQTRATLHGKEFEIMKFRSMIVNAEGDGKARLAAENDDRITPIGHFIRKTRIDELPQFFNILRGDMSIVGPRPERPEINKQYYEEIPEFAYRLHVKAGLTGYAQVYGKYNTTSYDKLKLDLIYVEKASVLLDIKLILQTLKVIFQKEATEGLEEGQTNASTKNQ